MKVLTTGIVLLSLVSSTFGLGRITSEAAPAAASTATPAKVDSFLIDLAGEAGSIEHNLFAADVREILPTS